MEHPIYNSASPSVRSLAVAGKAFSTTLADTERACSDAGECTGAGSPCHLWKIWGFGYSVVDPKKLHAAAAAAAAAATNAAAHYVYARAYTLATTNVRSRTRSQRPTSTTNILRGRHARA